MNVNKKSEKGQVLLITIMLLAVAITLVLTLAFRSKTETKITKLEEDSQKALNAAEAAVEVALKNNSGSYTFSQLGLSKNELSSDVDFINSSVTVSESPVDEFASPLLQKDEQYTFYLSQYDDSVTPPTFTNPWNGTLQVYAGADSPTGCGAQRAPAIELSLIYGNGAPYQLKRWVLEPCTTGDSIEGAGVTGMNGTNVNIDGNTFTLVQNFTIDAATYPSPKVIIARALYSQTRVGFGHIGGGQLPPQGKQADGDATLRSTTTQTVKLFRTNPQIPAGFFETVF